MSCPGKSEKAHFALSLPLSTAVRHEKNAQSSYVKTLKSKELRVDWGRRPEFEILPNHIPLPLTHSFNLTHQKWAVCRWESSWRCLLVLAPARSTGGLNAQRECGNPASSSSGLFLSFLLLSPFSPAPYSLLSFPLLSSLFLCSSPQQPCGGHSITSAYRSQNYEKVGSSSAFNGAAILRGGAQPPLPFSSLSSVSPICMQSHGRAWQSEILAQRLKSGPRESKSTREIMKRKKLGKATP